MPVVLASLPELVIAIIITLLIWAARPLFGPMLSSFASRIPLLGSVLASAIESITADVVSAGIAEADSMANGLLGLVLAPIYWLEHLIADGLDILDAARQVIAYVATVMIPQAVQLAWMQAQVLVARAESALESLISAEVRIIQGEFAQVYATITAVEHALVAYVQAEITAVEREITAAISAETAFVEASIHAVETELATALATETAFVESEFKAAIAYTTSVAASLTADIDYETSAITSWVTSQLVSLTGAIDMVQAATLAIALSAAKAVETDLGNLKSECTDNLCSGLGGAASLVNGLLEQGFVAALLGYAAWGASDPRGCGNATADVLVPIASAAKDTVDAAMSAL